MNATMNLTVPSYSRKVCIPSTFFLTEATREYYNLPLRLLTELVQNSIDAGASIIDMEFDDDRYTFKDNGIGMDTQTLIDGMLTMGGSIKSIGSTGGFGAAKKLIVFSHDKYKIVTNNIIVNGSVLEYDLEEHDDIIHSGTSIECYYSDRDLFCKENMVDAAYSVLSRCYFDKKIEVYINGIPYNNFPKFKGTKTEANFGEVYTFIDRKNKDTTHRYITVLHNGMFMFNSPIGYETNMEIVVNVLVPSKEAFSQNRSSFIGDFDVEFSELKTKMLSNKKALTTNRIHKFNIPGLTDFSFIGNSDRPTKMAAFYDNKMDITNIKETLEKLIECKTQDGDIPNFAHTIHYICPESLDEKELKKISPGTWIDKYKFVLSLFNTLLMEIARIRKDNISYGLGFIIEENTQAFIEIYNDMPIFYINPYVFKRIETMKEKFYFMLMIAIHEYTHFLLRGSLHDEEFNTTFTYLTSKVLSDINGSIKLTKDAREANI